ncbi:uncharacterized protein FA14DRAFT_178709 [Meira miltonrushii]|uniref:Zn(2)-C6 fungal-type domain-containing protein n=1 Tax=Meira miltonrushii TaxID=1280837 RepID=A0A316VG82_9BASI|nr:uncharacterized protein FA14DRAFT_178709 [Meira miltonrushii]PWN35333.1 hypothetical protein FA14DRAFT_178709 [Meira miltonrushii]
MLNRSCERCRVKKLRCPGGKICEICITADTNCIYKQRKKKVMRKKRLNQTIIPPKSRSNSDNTSDDVSRDSFPSESTPASSIHPPSLSSSSTSASATSQFQTCRPLNELNQSLNPGLFPDDLESLLHEARSTISFSLEACEILLNLTFRWRILPTIHGCIHIDSLIQLLRTLFAKTERYHGAIRQTITFDQLTLILLTLSATLYFVPPDGDHAAALRTALKLSKNMKKEDAIASQRAIFLMAERMIYTRLSNYDSSLEGIQSSIMYIFHHRSNQATTEQIYDRALRCALKMGLHRITGYSSSDEVKVRIWWYLVTRNWLAAPATWVYTIFPGQFSTRMPLNVEYSDLEFGLDKDTVQTVRRDWTPASYSLALITLATTIRELVDMHNSLQISEENHGLQLETAARSPSRTAFQSKIVKSFELLAKEYVWYYRLEEKFTISKSTQHDLSLYHGGRIEIERWMLHQQMFHCFLELHEVDSFIDQDVPTSCLALAYHILDTVHLNARRCSVMSSSSLPKRSLITAASVVAFHVLNKGQLDESWKEYKEVAAATAKAKLLAGEVNLQTLSRLETLLSSWSTIVPNRLNDEVKEEIKKWEVNDIWVNEYATQLADTNAQAHISLKHLPDLIPQLSHVMPAYQADIGDADWESVWAQLLANNEFPFAGNSNVS